MSMNIYESDKLIMHLIPNSYITLKLRNYLEKYLRRVKYDIKLKINRRN